jgi:hypothetical protein
MSIDVKKLLGSLVVFSMVACGAPEASSEAELSTSVFGLQGDLDEDGIADAEDNCPGRPNAEQFDVDGDGRGDECDFNLVPFLPTSEGLVVPVAAGDQRQQMVAVAGLANHSHEAVALRAWSDRPWLLVPQGLTVPVGEEFDLVATINPAGLPAGRHYGKVHIDEAGRIRVIIVIIDVIDVNPGFCMWSIYLKRTGVISDQGWLDGKLELEIEGTVDGVTAHAPYAGGYYKVAEANSRYITTHIKTFLIRNNGTTVTKSVDIQVTEHDNGLLGADETGTGRTWHTMKCGNLPQYSRVNIGIGDGGTVWVETKAKQVF